MKRNLGIFIIIDFIFLLLILTGCSAYNYKSNQGVDETKIETQNPYKLFSNLDFSNEPIYYYINYYDEFSLDQMTKWDRIMEQNPDLLNTIQNSSFSNNIHLDDSAVTYINGKTSYLKVIYDDSQNPVLTREIPVVCIDITIDLYGNQTNILPAFYQCSSYYKENESDSIEYNIDFTSYDDDYYSLTISKGAYTFKDIIVHSYFSKYIGPITYYLKDVPLVKLWKENHVGFRLDTLNTGETSQDTLNKTQYYVFSRDISKNVSASTLNLFGVYSQGVYYYDDDQYDIDSITYSKDKGEFDIVINVSRDKENILNKTFILLDDSTITYDNKNLDYVITIKKVSEEIVNITFKSKTKDRFLSYSLTPSEIS